MRARLVIADLAGVVVPVVAATIVMLGGAFAVRRYAGPAQSAYQAAMTGRLDLLVKERDEQAREIASLRDELATLRAKVADLERQVRELTSENLELRRALPSRTRAPHA